MREAVKKELQTLCDQGVITPVEATEWLAPIVVARKTDGNICICIDLRSLNKEVVVDKFPLPKITEIFTRVSGATVFTTLDLTSAYYQVHLHPDSQDYTAFITPMGAFKFKRMPFGLVSAASVFQRAMTSILEVIPGVFYYQVDLFILVITEEVNEGKLGQVLEKLGEHA